MTSSAGTGSCAAHLKASTKAEHAATEGLLLPLIRNASTLADYAALLQLFHRVFAPLEKAIGAHVGSAHFPDLSRRRNAACLEQDLQELGAAVPEGAEPFFISSFAEALGALYVLEGSTLGGIHIARMLRSRIPLPEKTTRFLESYGNDRMVLWQRFTDRLDELVPDTTRFAEITSGARTAFHAFQHVITARHEQQTA